MEPRVTYPDLQIHPGVRNAVLVDMLSRVSFAEIGKKKYPFGAILHFDADIDPYTEQTGGPHTFNHAVLSPQYQRNADGSYSNVGAKPAVDTFDGERWLRSCGAVTNLVPSTVTTNSDGSVNCQSAGFSKGGCSAVSPNLVVPQTGLMFLEIYAQYPVTGGTTYCGYWDVEYSGLQYIQIIGPGAVFGEYMCNFDILNGVKTAEVAVNSVGLSSGIFSIGEGRYRVWVVATAISTNSAGRFALNFIKTATTGRGVAESGWNGIDGVRIYAHQLTATSYPVPYVPPGVTQPASNATTTNGSWFSLPNGSPLWHALDGGPETDGVELYSQSIYWSDPQITVSDLVATVNTAWVSGASNRVHYSTSPLAVGSRVKVCFRVLATTLIATWNGSTYVDQGTFTPGLGCVYATTTTLDKVTLLLKTLNGSIDNISIQRLQPQPLTLATRIRMGVGSGDLPESSLGFITPRESSSSVQYGGSFTGTKRIISSYDLTSGASINSDWPRNVIVNRITQVNAAGTHIRVGYMIEGTHTAIQWSAWYTYDGSFNPATIYRFMLGYNTPYPMWYNKITVWKEEVSDDRILAAMS